MRPGRDGIAPNSTVELYNPFDQTGTASWSDVAQGIYTLYQKGAYVVNASLGVPGSVLSSDWAKILTSPQLSNRGHDLVLVKAAGNDGLTQTANVPWIGNQAPNNLILVGSVDRPTRSRGSRTRRASPASWSTNVCQQQNKLMYRYIVAPGELVLASDNHGGVARMTGTSFAAPLVTGAIALLQDRWPWLQQHAEETVQIILQSADDLGARASIRSMAGASSTYRHRNRRSISTISWCTSPSPIAAAQRRRRSCPTGRRRR